jgi:predicted metal-binding membrane protein
MTAAMMLPSTVPMLLLVDRLHRGAVPPFAIGYLVAWTIFGVAAYEVGMRIGWNDAGVLLIAAGVYQVLPLKRACLRRCRNPLAFLRAHGRRGPLLTGIAHGAYCVGCCLGLMLAVLAIGIASVTWMAVAAAAILAEKVLPHGELVAAGTLVVLQ